jgi:phospholipase D1/2
MPFSESFWKSAQHNPEGAAKLTDVKGFITTLPVDWTKDENNNMGYHMALVTDNRDIQKADPNYKDETIATAPDNSLISPTNSDRKS